MYPRWQFGELLEGKNGQGTISVVNISSSWGQGEQLEKVKKENRWTETIGTNLGRATKKRSHGGKKIRRGNGIKRGV